MELLSSRPILLVEDNPDLRVMMTTVLELEGRQVLVASNGREAFNLARSHQPSLIILDLMMPVMTGEEFRHAQLANAAIRKIPVVVVSAHHEAARIARKMKAIACLSKPLDFDALSAVVRRASPRVVA